MKSKFIYTIVIFFFSLQFSAQNLKSDKTHFSAGVLAGYYDNLSFYLFGGFSNFTKEIPLSVRFGLGYTTTNPGTALDARRLFINDNTNGTPEKHGSRWDMKLDLIYPISLFGSRNFSVLAGPRYSNFTANFNFIGGNEEFDVTSSLFGLGVGLETKLTISDNVGFLITGGADYYFPSILDGHDTAYSPDGDNKNPRKDYNFDDADEIINQPVLEPYLLGGIIIRF